MHCRILIKIFLSIFLLLTTSGCSFIDNIAGGILYPWSSVNKRMDKRDSKQPPEGVLSVNLSNGTNAYFRDTGSGVAVLYLHGNAESAVDLGDNGFLEFLRIHGISYIVPDYPGMGIGGTGEPNEASLIETALLARNELLRRVKPETKVCIWGRSLGAAVAAQAAFRSNNQIDCLILISPWTSFRDVALENILGRFISDKFHMEHSYLTNEVCKSIEMPTMIVHGEKDKVIPYEHGERLTSCFSINTFYGIQSFGHNDIYGGDVLKMITQFLFGS